MKLKTLSGIRSVQLKIRNGTRPGGWRPMENESKVADGWRFLTRALSTEGYLKVSFHAGVGVDRDGDGNYLGAQTAILHPAP